MKKFIRVIIVFFIFSSLTLCGTSSCKSIAKDGSSQAVETAAEKSSNTDSTLQHATFALGCFWHSEEIFLEIKGVSNALPGYCGGTEANPSYELVGSSSTRYAESVDVAYDPSQISYQKLLEVFFAEHDPTTPDRAGPDEGPQYRSAIFYHNAEQKQEAEAYIAKLTAEHKYSSPIITQVAPFVKFNRAEDYHIRYYRNHPDQGYIASVTRPEVEKFQKDFPELVK